MYLRENFVLRAIGEFRVDDDTNAGTRIEADQIEQASSLSLSLHMAFATFPPSVFGVVAPSCRQRFETAQESRIWTSTVVLQGVKCVLLPVVW